MTSCLGMLIEQLVKMITVKHNYVYDDDGSDDADGEGVS